MYIELIVHPYDIETKDKHIDEKGDEHTEIRLWCFDKDSTPILCRIPDFPVFCKVELPILIDHYGNVLKWNQSKGDDIFKLINKALKSKNIGLAQRSNYLEWTKLYYYSGGKKYPYLLLVFNTISDMKAASRICKRIYYENKKIELVFRECNVDLYNKMFSYRNLGPTDKFKCKAKLIPYDSHNRISIESQTEYIIDWRTINKLEPEKSDWFTKPLIFSWDIETYSSRHRAFPQKHYYKDIVFSISVSIQRYREPDTLKNIVIIMGMTEKVENVQIIQKNTEIEVIEAFFDLIEHYNPDVLIGYNIFGFDYDYLDARLIDVGKKWRNVGRLIDEECSMTYMSWNSGAYGYNKLNILKCPGRISIDMLPYIKRDYKLPMYNLNSVGKFFLGESKVDLKAHEMFQIHKSMMDISKEIKSETGKNNDNEAYMSLFDDVKKNTSHIKKCNKAIKNNTLIVKYNVQDSVLVLRLFEKLNVWISLIELSNIVRVTPMDLFTRGQQVRCIAQLYHEASKREIVLTQRENKFIYFNGGKVENPISGFWEMVLCFDFNSLYPSIMIAYNICFTTLLRNIDGVDKNLYNHFEIEQEEPIDAKPPSSDTFDYGDYMDEFEDKEDKSKKVKRNYEFGFVKKEKCKGLLPEILENILNERKKVKKQLKGTNKTVDIIDTHLFTQYRKNNKLSFKDIQDTITRQHIKKIIPTVTDDTLIHDHIDVLQKNFDQLQVNAAVFDSRQLGLKVSANSIYGFLGAQTMGKFSLIEGSMCVTSRGRELITESAEFFGREYNATTVYGDTDSTMVYVPELNNDPKRAWEMAESMEQKINGTPDVYKDGKLVKKGTKGIFPAPLYLEFEKAMRALFMKKKHYAYMTYDKYGNIDKEKNSDLFHLNVKGIILARRDNCNWVRTTYETMIRKIFDKCSMKEALQIIVNAIIDVIECKFNITENLSIIKSMGSNYKSKTFYLSIFSEIMKSISRPINAGERFPYVIVKDYKNRDKVGEKMRTNELFIEQWETSGYTYGDDIPSDFKSKIALYPPEQIDSSYYIINVLQGPIDNLFEYGFKKELEDPKFEKIYYQPKRTRLKKVHLKNPISMIAQMMKDMKKEIEEQGIHIIIPYLKLIPLLPEKYN